MDLLFPELAPLLKAYATKYPERLQGTVYPTLDELQSVRCATKGCNQPKKDYMDAMPCAYCEAHMPPNPFCKVCDTIGCQEPSHKEATITPKQPASASLPQSVFKTPLPTLVGSKEMREKRKKESKEEAPPPKPVKRRLTFEEEDIDSINIEFFERVHARYDRDPTWLRRPRPKLNTITNNLRAVEVHLQQVKEQQDNTEQHVLNKIAVLGERQFDLEEGLTQVVESINRIDDSVDKIQENITDLCKLVDELINKQK